jgi:hypothetical protein
VRGETDPALAELAHWWEQAQESDPADLGEMLAQPSPAAQDAADTAAPRTATRKRRRRRRPKPAGSNGGAPPAES